MDPVHPPRALRALHLLPKLEDEETQPIGETAPLTKDPEDSVQGGVGGKGRAGERQGLRQGCLSGEGGGSTRPGPKGQHLTGSILRAGRQEAQPPTGREMGHGPGWRGAARMWEPPPHRLLS